MCRPFTLKGEPMSLSLGLVAAAWLAQAGMKDTPISANAKAPPKPDTPHLEFVTEYIRELSACEELREKGEKEIAQESGDPGGTLGATIHSGTLIQLELRSAIARLKAMHLNGDLADSSIRTITTAYEEKIKVWKEIVDVITKFIEGPKPGVAHGTFAAEMPRLRAQLDFIDQTLFQATPVIFYTLIDHKEDSRGHANHLIVTKAERQVLIDQLNTAFSAKLDQKNQPYCVGSASVLRIYLLKPWKASDEPWE